jgi:hypothetical protein
LLGQSQLTPSPLLHNQRYVTSSRASGANRGTCFPSKIHAMRANSRSLRYGLRPLVGMTLQSLASQLIAGPRTPSRYLSHNRFVLQCTRMYGEYHEEWQELRTLRRRIIVAACVGLACLLLLGEVRLLPPLWSRSIGLAALASWCVSLYTFFYNEGQYCSWSCPRCGERFHWKQYRFGRNVNPFARRCLHCALPKWAETDPNPDLKRQLDPFRTDKILGLNDTLPRL